METYYHKIGKEIGLAHLADGKCGAISEIFKLLRNLEGELYKRHCLFKFHAYYCRTLNKKKLTSLDISVNYISKMFNILGNDINIPVFYSSVLPNLNYLMENDLEQDTCIYYARMSKKLQGVMNSLRSWKSDYYAASPARAFDRARYVDGEITRNCFLETFHPKDCSLILENKTLKIGACFIISDSAAINNSLNLPIETYYKNLNYEISLAFSCLMGLTNAVIKNTDNNYVRSNLRVYTKLEVEESEEAQVFKVLTDYMNFTLENNNVHPF